MSAIPSPNDFERGARLRPDDPRALAARDRIPAWRNRLLDLSGRNRLLNFKHDARGANLVRIIDGSIEALFEQFSIKGSRVCLEPLPPASDEPADERTPEFRQALGIARLVDKQYLAAKAALGQEEEDLVEGKMAEIELALRKRVRKARGMRERSHPRLDPEGHARDCGLHPEYDLHGRRSDSGRDKRSWQTRLDEDSYVRRLKAILAEANEKRQEFGIESLHVIFGFLEWRPPVLEGEEPEVFVSPLVVQGAVLDKVAPDPREGRAYPLYFLSESPTDFARENRTLRERLKSDFHLELPEFDDESPLADYFAKVERVIRGKEHWRVRKLVTVAHLAFSRLPMWLDLDPAPLDGVMPHCHPLLGTIFGEQYIKGSERGGPGGDEISALQGIDPPMVLGCDSSQARAIREALRGRNLVIQGPPGTGKSQTIANLIAAAMAQGKTVLFVAEKQVALEVVERRLKEVGLGPYVLSLHSASQARSVVLDHLKARLELPPVEKGLASVAQKHANAAENLDRYARQLGEKACERGWTRHDVLWREIEGRERPLPDALRGVELAGLGSWTEADWAERMRVVGRQREALAEIETCTGANAHWNWVMSDHLSEVAQDDLLGTLARVAQRLQRMRQVLPAIEGCDLQGLRLNWMKRYIDAVSQLGDWPEVDSAALWDLARREDAREALSAVQTLLSRLDACESTLRGMAPRLLDPALDIRATLQALVEAHGRLTPKIASLRVSEIEQRAAVLVESGRAAGDLAEQVRELSTLPVFSWVRLDVTSVSLLTLLIKLGERCPRVLLRGSAPALDRDGTLQVLRKWLDELRPVIASAAEQASALALVEGNLEEPELRMLADALDGAWFGSALFSAEYRRARRLLAEIDPGASTSTGGKVLRRLAELLRQLKELKAHHGAVLLPDLYRGRKTDISAIEEVVDWCASVEGMLPGSDPASRRVRSILLGHGPELASALETLASRRIPDRHAVLERARPATALSLEALARDYAQIAFDLRALSRAAQMCGFEGEVSVDRLHRLEALVGELGTVRTEVLQRKELADLLRADPSRTLEAFRKVLAARTAAEKVPIGPVWLDRATSPGGKAIWDGRRHEVQSIREEVDSAIQDLTEVQRRSQADSAWLDQQLRKTLVELESSLGAWLADRRGLSLRCESRQLEFECTRLGLAGFREATRSLVLDAKGACTLLEGLAVEQLAKEARRHITEFSDSRAKGIEDWRNEFLKWEEQLLHEERRRVRSVVAGRIAPEGVAVGRVKDRTELALISHVCGQQRPRISLRELVKRAGRAMQELMPCFLMSPLSVAQLVPRQSLSFDLVIFDEASQIRPEDALCALMRARQCVIVGDSQQLPPTTFGMRTGEGWDDAGDEESANGDTESILDLVVPAFGEGVMLRWHYRSRDPALIAFSNVHFYDNRLFLFPNPDTDRTHSGVHLRRVEGVYSARTNEIEARACVDLAVEQMKRFPGRSLGIVALNRPQADLISELLEDRIGKDKEAREYQNAWSGKPEPLLVKNLESIQGDERDVILISTVFGRDGAGAFANRFGPINSEGGHRRLNVLFTRAKHQVIVLTSMESAWIRLGENSRRGVRVLRDYLDYAVAGLPVIGRSEGGPESHFERVVCRALERSGVGHACQIGVKGFFIDIGIRDPDRPDRFLLGVECDGATYHRHPSVRDRDKLRQEILEQLGWKIHRIWSTHWFRDPDGELKKLLSKIATLRNERAPRETHTHRTSGQGPLVTAIRATNPAITKPKSSGSSRERSISEAIARIISARPSTPVPKGLGEKPGPPTTPVARVAQPNHDEPPHIHGGSSLSSASGDSGVVVPLDFDLSHRVKLLEKSLKEMSGRASERALQDRLGWSDSEFLSARDKAIADGHLYRTANTSSGPVLVLKVRR